MNTAYFNEEEFVHDLLTGSHIHYGFQSDFNLYNRDKYLDEIVHLENVVQRFRNQTRTIIESCRNWRKRHVRLDDKIEKQFSRYEGSMCIQDIRRHWFVYKYAMRQLCQKQQEYNRMLSLNCLKEKTRKRTLETKAAA